MESPQLSQPSSVSQPSTSSLRAARRASILAVLFVAVIFAIAGAFVWQRVTSPSDGVSQDIHGGTPAGVPLAAPPNPASGLREGDVILAVNGVSAMAAVMDYPSHFAPHPDWQVGHVVTYTVQRGDQTIDIPVRLEPFALGSFLAQAGPYLLYLFLADAIAIFVLIRRFTDPAARLMFLGFSTFTANQVCCTLGMQVYDYFYGVNCYIFLAVVAGLLPTGLALFAHFAWTFPRPIPLLARWPRLLGLVYIVPIMTFIFAPLSAVAISSDLSQALNAMGGVGNILWLLETLLIPVGVITTYFVARDTLARQQWRLVALPLAIFVASQSLYFAASAVLPALVPANPIPQLANGGWPWFAVGLSLLIPLGIAVAVLRFRLFDIDIIVNRGLVYAALTVVVLSLYGATVFAVGSLVQTPNNLLGSLLATGVVALAFQPLRQRLQRGINRLLYGQRDEPYIALANLGRRLSATLAPEAVLPTIAETVGQALKLPYVAITLREQGTEAAFRPAASYGVARDGALSLPLVYQRERLGELILAPRAPGESFGAADKRLLEDLARQIGVAAHAVRLTEDLRRANADLRASRERLVTAREEERRRLRRDLHDGLGPQLASLTLSLAAAREFLTRDPAAADSLLEQLTRHVQDAVADVRRLVYELRPPTLDDLGLLGALRDQAVRYSQGGLLITVDAPPSLAALPAAAEVAAYRICLEALTNVVRHANARTCVIHLRCDPLAHDLCVEIVDDGVGIQRGAAGGVGLRSMRERAEELGGSCVIKPLPGGGTSISARLPVAE